jgi:hypothetical protein
MPKELETVTKPAAGKGAGDVFLYVISGFKPRNPLAATALIDRLSVSGPKVPRKTG